MRRFEVVSGRGRWRSPRRRVVDRAPVRADGDYLRELALRRIGAGTGPCAHETAFAMLRLMGTPQMSLRKFRYENFVIWHCAGAWFMV